MCDLGVVVVVVAAVVVAISFLWAFGYVEILAVEVCFWSFP